MVWAQIPCEKSEVYHIKEITGSTIPETND